MSRLFFAAVWILTLSACSAFQHRPDYDKKTAPQPLAADASIQKTGTPATAPNAQKPDQPTSPPVKKGEVKVSKDNPEIKLIDKNGKAIVAPKEASVKGGKDMTKVEVPAGDDNAESDAKAAIAASGTTEAASETAVAKGSSRIVGDVPAMKALGWLKNGNTRFVKGRLRADGQAGKDRARLLAGQKPHAVIMSSSDSRMPPELIFDQKLGEVFVVRKMGQNLDSSTLSSLEYAVSILGSNLVVVMTHEDWSSIDTMPTQLQEKSRILRDAVASGDVKIVEARYNLGTGQVEWK